MHALLMPTSHAEVDILARNLSQSGLFGPDPAPVLYAKILFGSVLSLSVTESLHGVILADGKVIIKPLLIERVINRSDGYEVKIVTSSDEVCDLNFFAGGKICGQALTRCEEVTHCSPVNKQLLYQLTLARGARTFYPKLFGVKFLITKEIPQPPAPSADPAQPVDHSPAKAQVNRIMAQAGLPLPVDAATLPATPKLSYTRKEQAEHSKALLTWQNKVDLLSPENPGDWDAHAQGLKALTFLPESEQKGLWKKYKLAAERVGVGYDSENLKFYLIEWQAHEN